MPGMPVMALNLLERMDPETYINEALEFIIKYKWLHDFKLIRFFADRIYTKLPYEWFESMNSLSDLDLQRQLDNWSNGINEDHDFPESLQSFLHDVHRLSLERNATICPVTASNSAARDAEVIIPRHFEYGMNPKKIHEVSRIAGVIDRICCQNNIRTIVDMGAGMGYLDCILSDVLSYTVIAIESANTRTESAKERALRHSRQKHTISSRLHHETLHFDGGQESLNSLRSIISRYTDDQTRVCMVGLHCCGDLTPCYLSTFAALYCASAFCCVGCCYHLMRFDDCNFDVLQFPLSSYAIREKSRIWTEDKPLFTVSSLRLASQETKVKWLGDLDSYVQCHFFRALLECVADDMNVTVRRRRRHTSFIQNEPSFDRYMDDLDKNFILSGCTDIDLFGENMRKKKADYVVPMAKLRVFRILQGLVQSVLESFIAIDRLLHARNDLHIENVQLLPVFDETISPRNFAIIAVKGVPSRTV